MGPTEINTYFYNNKNITAEILTITNKETPSATEIEDTRITRHKEFPGYKLNTKIYIVSANTFIEQLEENNTYSRAYQEGLVLFGAGKFSNLIRQKRIMMPRQPEYKLEWLEDSYRLHGEIEKISQR